MRRVKIKQKTECNIKRKTEIIISHRQVELYPYTRAWVPMENGVSWRILAILLSHQR